MTYEEFDKEFLDKGFREWLKYRVSEVEMETMSDYALHLLSLAYNAIPALVGLIEV